MPSAEPTRPQPLLGPNESQQKESKEWCKRVTHTIHGAPSFSNKILNVSFHPVRLVGLDVYSTFNVRAIGTIRNKNGLDRLSQKVADAEEDDAEGRIFALLCPRHGVCSGLSLADPDTKIYDQLWSRKKKEKEDHTLHQRQHEPCCRRGDSAESLPLLQTQSEFAHAEPAPKSRVHQFPGKQ